MSRIPDEEYGASMFTEPMTASNGGRSRTKSLSAHPQIGDSVGSYGLAERTAHKQLTPLRGTSLTFHPFSQNQFRNHLKQSIMRARWRKPRVAQIGVIA